MKISFAGTVVCVVRWLYVLFYTTVQSHHRTSHISLHPEVIPVSGYYFIGAFMSLSKSLTTQLVRLIGL